MITTDFVKGSPCWIDLGSPDIDVTARFYGAVLGWEFEPYPEAEGYGTFKVDGKAVGAVGKLTEEGARSAWMIYFNTPDADETTQAVERLGGKVRVAPMDADGMGRMGQYTDPQGGEFAAWQPGKDFGLEAADRPGSLCWIELYTTDAAGAKEFYGSLFGWETEDMPLPGNGGRYTLIAPSGLGKERQHGGIMQLQPEHLTLTGGRAYWHPVFAVADCDGTVAKVTANGGSTQMGPETMEGVGRLAVCLDPHGADFVVLTPAEM